MPQIKCSGTIGQPGLGARVEGVGRHEEMRVVLRRAVPGLGESGDVKDVADGYGSNYLIPRGYAVLATPKALADLEAHKGAQQRQLARLDEERRSLAEQIEATPLTVRARAGAQGRLHGSVTATEIAEALTVALGRPIDKRDIELLDPIRHVGSHRAEVRLARHLSAKLTLVIEPEE
jgi:large subunit ribosomal protein L9